MALNTTLFFFQLPRDVEVLVPICEEMAKLGQPTKALITREFAVAFPDLVETIGEFCPLQYASARWIRWGLAPFWRGISRLVTASESSAPPHRVAHALTRRANRLGVQTFTVQHGFENIGLTYTDAEAPMADLRFAAQTIFTWISPRYLHSEIVSEVKNRVRPVGYPKVPCPFNVRTPHPELPYLVAVFENLHWNRYSASYREAFVAGLTRVAQEFPEVQFRVKPHPVGLWTKEKSAFPKNVELFEGTTSELLEHADFVITTPSTIAVEAALQNLPTAVFAGALAADLELYKPLSFIEAEADWSRLLAKARQSPVTMGALSRSFIDAKLNSGNGAAEIAGIFAKVSRPALDRVLSAGVEFAP